jgi:hypothetical protein
MKKVLVIGSSESMNLRRSGLQHQADLEALLRSPESLST